MPGVDCVNEKRVRSEYNERIDGIDGWFRPLLIYMYKREMVPILEGTCPFVNGPFGMAPS